MPSPVLRDRSSGLVVGTWSNLCITVVRNMLGLEDVQVARRIYQTFEAEQKNGFISVIVVGPQITSFPQDDVRGAIIGMMRDLHVTAMAGVLEAKGFRAAAARSVFAVMSMVSRVGYPRKITSSVPEAAVWIAEHMQPTSAVRDVESVITQVKEMAARS